ncbi:MAG: hypothetical protein QI223_08160 [Candidatus Korarchaeota archaeon]|nr:hypothetical protein [Candidatus Korarchaeota archaeon]
MVVVERELVRRSASSVSLADVAPRIYSELCERKRHALNFSLALAGLLAAVPRVLGLSGDPAAAILVMGVGLSAALGAAWWLDADDLIRAFEDTLLEGEDPLGVPTPVRWLSRWGGLIAIVGGALILLAAGLLAYL